MGTARAGTCAGSTCAVHRSLPIGAELAREGVRFRVWAPAFTSACVVIEAPERHEVALDRERDGHFVGLARGVGAGARYRFRFGDSPTLYADPASRYQPDGPFGVSQVVDPRDIEWTDAAWRGLPADRHVLYELHVGTFTRDGTWLAAARHLRYLADLGVTTIEMMPVAEFAGRRNWGYDGVLLFAPTHNYGTPADLRRFLDAAHAHGLAVILDVVYNHFGPAGCTMYELAPELRAARAATEWGDAIDFARAGGREPFI